MKPAAILIVDGNTARLASLVEPLQNAGYRAVGTDTFQTARSLLHTQSYDLIITDLKLAAYNGLHLVCHSRVLNPAAMAIVLNAIPDASSEIDARRLGAHYIGRSVDPGNLLALVGAVLEGAPLHPRTRFRPSRPAIRHSGAARSDGTRSCDIQQRFLRISGSTPSIKSRSPAGLAQRRKSS